MPQTITNRQHLTELCKAAGAAASTVFYSRDQVVVFYNQPQITGASQLNGFDELHIRHPKRARILIAVFPEPEKSLFYLLLISESHFFQTFPD